MMRFVSTLLAIALLFAGCTVHVHDGGDAAAVLGLAIFGAAVYQQESGGEPGARVPPLAPDRRIHEQDCSRPLEDPSANLRCR